MTQSRVYKKKNKVKWIIDHSEEKVFVGEKFEAKKVVKFVTKQKSYLSYQI
jgi:hypothetical protein